MAAWQSVTTDADGNLGGGTGTTEARTHNTENQINARRPRRQRNTITDDAGRTLLYDAWNRLVSVTPSGGSAKTYSYDALGYLPSTFALESDVTT